MKLPDGRPLNVDDGVLVDPFSEGRVVLWIPGAVRDGWRSWDRVGSVVGADAAAGHGLCWVAAASTPSWQKLHRAFGRLRDAVFRREADRGWRLPDGGSAEPCGPRRTGLRLVWPADETPALDAARVVASWPGAGDVRRLGPALFLVQTASGDDSAAEAEAEPRPETMKAAAERALAAARRLGDRRAEAVALVDLGQALLAEGEARGAADLLREAAARAGRLGDAACEADAASVLALAEIALGRPGPAREVLGAALALARSSGDRYAEKQAVDRLASAAFEQGDRDGALELLERARATAAELGDLRHEAVLLWRAAVVFAESSRRDQAVAAATASVDRLRRLGDPAADWYARHLAEFQSGGTVRSSPEETASGPGLLRSALTASAAMAKFVGSGFKTAVPEVRRGRLDACAACEHHTGVRCRVCGCFTAAKARMLHERCPTGRWPS